jgi:hypothetical protein
MKKVFFTVLILCSILITTLYAGDRLMIIEGFTSSTCGPCASNNPYLIAFMRTADLEKICAIAFHMNWPPPGDDPMYLHNPADNNGRRSYYGVNSIPQGRFDGFITLNSPYSTSLFQTYYDQRVNILSPVSIILTDSTIGDSVKIKARIYCESSLTNSGTTLYVAVYEDSIKYASPPGSNGETEFHWVMRSMLPNSNGTQLTLLPGDLNTYEFKYWKNPVWNQNQIRIMAFVQDNTTKEIVNAGKKTQNFTLLPYPAYKSVTGGQSGSATYKIKTPVIASGYTSPITFTASVNPVTTGITTSFPNGNVLSNFNDSLTLQVNSTSSVPTGTYQIIITGTNGNGKSHKTTVSYLVGKNYVSVGTNRNNEATFKVNGTSYLTTQLFLWDIGSNQTIQAVSPADFNTYRYIFQNWNVGGDTTQTININLNTIKYTANYKVQYQLKSAVTPGGVGPLVTITGGNTYHDSATTANMSISPTQVQYNGKTYYFNRWFGNGNGSYTGTNPGFSVQMNNFIYEIAVYDTINVGITQIGTEIPDEYALKQNYPNPFNPSTTIKFQIPQSELVTVKVYDMLGKEIAVLQDGRLSAGYYEVNFNAQLGGSSTLSSGVYFYRIETENFTDVKRMLLIK